MPSDDPLSRLDRLDAAYRYSTHIPVLRRFSPKRVLEFGAGFYSTAHFLSQPSLEVLVSVETDERWRRKLWRKFSDPRWTLTTKRKTPKDFDLVLVDDGAENTQRVETLRWVLAQSHPIVVIHDAEVPAYREIFESHPHVLHAEVEPWTAVVMPS